MKKVASIAMIALLAVGFTSCKKEYDCACTYDFAGTAMTYNWKTAKMTKKDAKTACEGYTATGWGSVKCELK